MKTLRLCLLVLLALLLPLRGAMGAAMLCPAMGEPPALAMQMDDTASDAALDEAHGGMTPACDEHAASSHDRASPCKLCCAFCALTPLPAGLPAVQTPPHFSTAAFPEPLSPAPSFLPGGLERPPKHLTFFHV